jgi:hypothetical protein
MQSDGQITAVHPAVEQMQIDGAQPGIQDPSKPFTLCVAASCCCGVVQRVLLGGAMGLSGRYE